MHISEMKREDLETEVNRMQNYAAYMLPRPANLPIKKGLDYYWKVEPVKACIGGDHLVVVNFDDYNIEERINAALKRAEEPDAPRSSLLEYAARLAEYRSKIGFAITDVQGHNISDSMLNMFFAGLFKGLISSAIKYVGEVTVDPFEEANTIFYNFLQPEYVVPKPFMTMQFVEVNVNGVVKWLSAGHPAPMVFSNMYNTIHRLEHLNHTNATPLGFFPSEPNYEHERVEWAHKIKPRYIVNDITLMGQGDIMLLFTDGFIEHHDGNASFCDARLENVLRDVKLGTASEIYTAIRKEMHSYCSLKDDMTLVVIKKT